MPNINAFFQWAVQKCNEPNVGYSQAYRNQQTVNGITYYDCSSFVNYALLAGGWTTPNYAPNNNAFTTYTQSDVLKSLGWKEVSATGEYKPGDIGLSDVHTEICYKGGQGSGTFMGAHTDEYPLAEQVSISTFTESYPQLFRYGDGGAVGLSVYVVAAICGNFWKESGINPGVWESLVDAGFTSLQHGYGLGQWTNTGGDTHGRLYKMAQWVLDNGYEVYDGNGQLAYVLAENYWTPQQEASSFATLDDFLNSESTDLAFLTHAWNIGWEGIHDGSWDARVGYAQQCLDFINENWENDSIKEWIYGNRYLSDNEKLNNAVMVYRWFNGNVKPGDINGIKKKHKMPLYMYLKFY